MNKQQLASSLGLAGFVMVVMAQPVRADVVKVTAIELNLTAQGIEIVLTTTDNKQGQVFISSFGKTDDVDGGSIESYVTLDYLGSIKLGAGELLIGIQNLLNEQYFPVYAQYFAPFDDSSNYAGQGRTLSVGYRVTW